MQRNMEKWFNIHAGRGIWSAKMARVEPYHHHAYHELLLVLSGDLIAVTPNQYLSHQGPCLLLYRAGRMHNQINRSGIVYERFYMDFFPQYDGIPAHCGELFAADQTEDAFLLPLSVRKAQQLSAVARILLELTEHQEHPEADERVRLLMGYVLTETARLYHRNSAPPRRTEAQYLSAVTQYISQHLGEKLTISSLAEQFHVGKTKLTADFSTYLSMTVNQYITTERITYARKLLEDGESVDRTAELCGYSDSGYFIRVFRKYEEMTPLQYKYRGSEREELEVKDNPDGGMRRD